MALDCCYLVVVEGKRSLELGDAPLLPCNGSSNICLRAGFGHLSKTVVVLGRG